MLRCRSVVFLCLICVVSSTCVANAMKKARRSKLNLGRTKLKGQYINMTINATSNVEEIRDTGRFLRWFDILTCDGYMLTVMRMVNKEGTARGNRTPVLLAHGMYQSSDRFKNQSNSQSLAFALSDAGFDVWLGNTRGNKYCRRHIYWEPETHEKMIFFNHSYEELAVHDTGDTVDGILRETNANKIIYIGHSLGGTLFLVLNSLKPEYNEKFEKAYLFAPFGYQDCFPDAELLQTLQDHFKIFVELIKLGNVEVFPPAGKDPNSLFSPNDCVGDKRYNYICDDINIQSIMRLKDGPTNSMEDTRGGAIQILEHFGQNVLTRRFQRYDYNNLTQNIIRYGDSKPPLYNVTLVTVPTRVIYTPTDGIIDEDDVLNLAKDMGYAIPQKVEKPGFSHEDFLDAPDVMEVVYKDIVAEIDAGGIPHKKLPGRGTVPVPSHWGILLLIGLELMLT